MVQLSVPGRRPERQRRRAEAARRRMSQVAAIPACWTASVTVGLVPPLPYKLAPARLLPTPAPHREPRRPGPGRHAPAAGADSLDVGHRDHHLALADLGSGIRFIRTWPSGATPMSADVPPTSRVITCRLPLPWPALTPASSPAAGPDISSDTGRRIAASAVTIPPPDVISRTCAAMRVARSAWSRDSIEPTCAARRRR